MDNINTITHPAEIFEPTPLQPFRWLEKNK